MLRVAKLRCHITYYHVRMYEHNSSWRLYSTRKTTKFYEKKSKFLSESVSVPFLFFSLLSFPILSFTFHRIDFAHSIPILACSTLFCSSRRCIFVLYVSLLQYIMSHIMSSLVFFFLSSPNVDWHTRLWVTRQT